MTLTRVKEYLVEFSAITNMYVTESTFSGGHRCHTKNSTKIAGFKVDHANEEGFHQLQQTLFQESHI